jgi:hypothetical protein
MGIPDPRKQRLIWLAVSVALACLLDLLILGIYSILFDWFTSTYLRMHEWKSLMTSLNKPLDWRLVNWKGSSGLVFVCSSVCASLTTSPFIIYFAKSKKLLILDFCATLTLFHLVLVLNTSGIPTCWQWWVLKLSSFLAQALASRFLLSQLIIPIRRLPLPRPPGVGRITHTV